MCNVILQHGCIASRKAFGMCKQCALSRRPLCSKFPRLKSPEHCDHPALPNVTEALRAPGVIAFPDSLPVERNSEQVLLQSCLNYVAVKFWVVLVKEVGGPAE